MHFRLLFPSKYLAAADLGGKDCVLTIRTIVVEDIETARETEKRPCMYFEESKDKGTPEEKRLVLNRTNAKTIAKLVSDPEIDNWKGKRITLFPTTVSAFGEEVDAVRVRPTQPPAVKPVATTTKE